MDKPTLVNSLESLGNLFHYVNYLTASKWVPSMRNLLLQVRLKERKGYVDVCLSHKDLADFYHVIVQHSLQRFDFPDEFFGHAIFSLANEDLFESY